MHIVGTDTWHHHRMMAMVSASAVVLAVTAAGVLALEELQHDSPDLPALVAPAVDLGTGTAAPSIIDDPGTFDRAVAEGIATLTPPAAAGATSIMVDPGAFDRAVAEGMVGVTAPVAAGAASIIEDPAAFQRALAAVIGEGVDR